MPLILHRWYVLNDVSEMKNEKLEKKLKRERVEVCLNCKNFLNCEDIGRFEDCADFVEVEEETWAIKKNSTLVRANTCTTFM